MGNVLPPERALARAKALVKQGKNDAARALLIDVTRRFPKNARLRKALITFDMPKSAGRSPELAAQVRQLASLCESRQFDKAVVLGNSLLKALPGDPAVMLALAAALVEERRPHDALSLYEAIIRMAPTFARAWTGFGTALAKLERHHHAISALNQALEFSPFDTNALNSLGSSLRGLNRHQDALGCFEEVLRLEDNGAARKNYGTTLMELGRARDAEDQFTRALDLLPDSHATHRDYSLVHKYRPGDPHIAQMEDLERRKDASLDDSAQLSFALAKAYDETGETEKAFKAWSKANALRRRDIGYDEAHERNRFDTISRLFGDYALTPISFDPIPYKPVFIVGMPRSGTSLCEEILARHPKVWGAGELEEIRLAVTRAAEANDRRLSHDMVAQVRGRYLHALKEIQAPQGVVTDKMPGNFRFVGFMRLAFPEATIIHMKRDPMAVCWSLFRSYFAIRGHGYAYDLTDAADYYARYAELMALYDRLWPSEIHTTFYEQLTEDPEREVRAILDACGLEFDRACLEHTPSQRAVRTVSALQVREGIYKGSSEAWRRYERHLEPLRSRLADHGLLQTTPPTSHLPGAAPLHPAHPAMQV
ncbi:MAG: sulfotransferase [Pseudomonadota bacterium]